MNMWQKMKATNLFKFLALTGAVVIWMGYSNSGFAEEGFMDPADDSEVLYQLAFEKEDSPAEQVAFLARALRLDPTHAPAAARLKFLLTYHTWPVEVSEAIRAALLEAPVLGSDHPLLALPPAEGTDIPHVGNQVVMQLPDESGNVHGEISLWIEDLTNMQGGFAHAYDFRVMIKNEDADSEARIVLRSKGDPIVSAQFSSNRQHLLIASRQGRIWLFDRGGNAAEIDGVRVVPAIDRAGFIGETRLAEIVDPDGARHFFDLRPGAASTDLSELPTLEGWLGAEAEERTILTIDFSPDGRLGLLTGVFDMEADTLSAHSLLIDLSEDVVMFPIFPRDPDHVIVKGFFINDGREVAVAELPKGNFSTRWGPRPSYHSNSSAVSAGLSAVYSASDGSYLREWNAQDEVSFAFAGQRPEELRETIREAVGRVVPDTDWPQAEFVALTEDGRLAMAHVRHRYAALRDESETIYTQSGFDRLDSIHLVDWPTRRVVASFPLTMDHTALPEPSYGAALINPHLLQHRPNFTVASAFSANAFMIETRWERETAPEWLPDLAERIAGLRIGPWMTPQEAGSTPGISEFRAMTVDPEGPDARWLGWFLADRETRSAAPFSFLETER